jgi:hypothetical protein
MMTQPTMTRTERAEWERKREAYETPIVEAARRAGRLAVIDCTAKDYPVPPAILRELERLGSPETRERAVREASELRRKAKSLRSLAELLLERATPGKLKAAKVEAEALRAKAAEHEALADVVEAAVQPL